MESENNELLKEVRKLNRLMALNVVRGLESKDAILTLSNSGFSTPEIAKLLGKKPDTVRKTITRAK